MAKQFAPRYPVGSILVVKKIRQKAQTKHTDPHQCTLAYAVYAHKWNTREPAIKK